MELRKGTTKRGHPFRYCTLATVGLNATARLRTIVLRRVTENLNLVFYTDKRSKKVGHIRENDWVSLLFYHPKQLLQLKVEGKATIISDADVLQKYYSGVQPASRKDYTTISAPGTPISDPDQIEHFEDKNFFSMVEVEPLKIEYLKLKRPDHLRILFTKEQNNFTGQFLMP